jgi:hypothetical protein
VLPQQAFSKSLTRCCQLSPPNHRYNLHVSKLTVLKLQLPNIIKCHQTKLLKFEHPQVDMALLEEKTAV